MSFVIEDDESFEFDPGTFGSHGKAGGGDYDYNFEVPDFGLDDYAAASANKFASKFGLGAKKDAPAQDKKGKAPERGAGDGKRGSSQGPSSTLGEKKSAGVAAASASAGGSRADYFLSKYKGGAGEASKGKVASR